MARKAHKEDESRRLRAFNKDEGVVGPIPDSLKNMPDGYGRLLNELKKRIHAERLKSVFSANQAMVLLYWDIGRSILDKQDAEGWGAKTIDRLSCDLREAFPEMAGFSPRNLKYMRAFCSAWADREFVQRTVAQIPWRSNVALLDKLDNIDLRLWYASKTIENGWSRDILCFQIDTHLHKRLGGTINNFPQALPPGESDLAAQAFKDPYLFDFLGTAPLRRESELERKLIEHLEKFLIELGQGFAFVGRQVHLEVGGENFYIDLLFYHLRLRRYVVIDLKFGNFEVGHVAKLNMYLNIVDDLLKHPDDQKTIGLLLVKEKSHTLVKYALNGYVNPIGVAEWEQLITESIPEEFKSSLPSIEDIESEFSSDKDIENREK